MKKYLATLVIVGFFVALPVHAQTTGTVNQSTLQATLNALRAQLSQLYSQLPAAAITSVTTKTDTKITLLSSLNNKVVKDVPSDISPITSPGCRPTMTPVGTINQTIRCDGRDWVAAGNLLNNGTSIGIGTGYFMDNSEKLRVQNSLGSGTAISGYAGNTEQSIGVVGVANGELGVGVKGHAEGNIGVAVMAENSDSEISYGFVQTGINSLNFFQGHTGIGGFDAAANTMLNVRSSDSNISAIHAVGGGIMITAGITGRPTCTNEHRGLLWFNNLDAQVDHLSVCGKDGSGTLIWKDIF